MLFCFFVFHLFLGHAKPSLPALVAGYGLVQAFLVEVGPIGVTEIQLGIGNLPQQIVGYGRGRCVFLLLCV